MRDLARVLLITSLIAACGGADFGGEQPSSPKPPAPEVRADAALPTGAIARCGTELMMSRWPIRAGFVSDAGDARVIEARHGELELRDPGHPRAALSLGEGIDARFAGDGKSVFKLQSSFDKQTLTIARMNAETGAVLWTANEAMEHFFPTWAVSRESATLTIAANREIASFDGVTGKRTRSTALRDQQTLALASDAPVALVRPSRTEILTVLDLAAGKSLLEISVPDTLREIPHRYLLSSDGRRVVAVSAIGVWATEPDKEKLEQRAGFAASREDSYAIPEAMFVDDGRAIHVALRERSVRVGLATAGAKALPGARASAVAVSANGKYFLTLDGMRLNLEGSSYQPPVADESVVSELAYFAADSRLATLSDKLHVWDAATCKHEASLDEVGSMLAVSKEAGVLAVTREDGTISVLDSELHELKRLRTTYDLRSMALDAAGKQLWVVAWTQNDEPPRRAASPPGSLVLPAKPGVFRVDLASWEITKLDDSVQPLRALTVAISPSTERVAMSAQTGLWAYDAATTTPVFRSINPYTFGFIGPRTLLTFESGVAMLRGSDLTEPFRRGPSDFAQHVGGQPMWMSTSDGGSKVALAFPKRVELLDPREGALLGALPVSDSSAMALSKDGKRIAIASREGVYLWGAEKIGAASPNVAVEHALPGVSSITQLGGGYWGQTVAVVGERVGVFHADGKSPFATLASDAGVSRAVATSEAMCFIASGKTHCSGRSVALFRSAKPTGGGPSSLDLPTSAKASELALAGGVACALDVQGDVTCIGEFNAFFEMPYKKPTRVLSDASAIAVGGAHACALKKDGRVACWGEASEGQVGSLQDKSVQVDTSTAASGPRHQVPSPFLVPGVEHATAIATGNNHSCALAGGTVICWGSNEHGQCGLRRGEKLDPAPIAGLADVTSISAARDLTCALQKSGDVSCWGAPGTAQFYGPTSVAKRAKAMRVIDETVCIERVDATVSCLAFTPP